MIQRIQTIYLLGVTVLVTLCFFIPSAELTSHAAQTVSFSMLETIKTSSGKEINEILAFITGVSIGIAFGSIFLYKKRKSQLRICLLLIAILLIVEALAFIEIQQLKKELGMMVSYQLPFIFPIVSAILSYLAYRGIKKDEELVQSYDRLR